MRGAPRTPTRVLAIDIDAGTGRSAGIRRQLSTQALNDSAAQCSQGSSWVSGLLDGVCWRWGRGQG